MSKADGGDHVKRRDSWINYDLDMNWSYATHHIIILFKPLMMRACFYYIDKVVCKQYYQQKDMVFQSTKVHCLIWIMYVKPLKSVNFIGRRITLARVNINWRLNQYTYIFKELLNPPHSVLKRPHIHTARLHDLSKFGFFIIHMKRSWVSTLH